MKQELQTFTDRLSTERCAEEREPFELQKLNEGYKIPSPVSYVARIGNYKTAGYAFTGIMDTLGSILDYGYLWNQIRVKGGAYGAMSFYGPTTGNVAFLSYRDPNVGATNDVFNGIPEYQQREDALLQHIFQELPMRIFAEKEKKFFLLMWKRYVLWLQLWRPYCHRIIFVQLAAVRR